MDYSKKKRLLIISFLVAAILLVAFFTIPALTATVKTPALLLNLLIPEGNWRPLEILTPDPIKEEYTIKSTNDRNLTIDIYRLDKNQKNKTAIVVYTPFAGEALEDPRLINLAQSFARVGFVVAIVARDIEPLIVSAKDVDDVIAATLFLKEKTDLEISSLGLFGLSYGNGPAIAAAANPKIKDDVDFIISFAGFYDLKNEFEFIQTGNYSYQDIKGEQEPHDYAKEILTATLDHYQIKESELAEDKTLAELRNDLSPAKHVDDLSVDFFITHSTDDTLIPYTESLRLHDSLAGRDNVYFALNSIFAHGEYQELNFKNFIRSYIPTFTDFYKLIYILILRYG